MLGCLMSALGKLGVECTNLYGDWGPESLHEFDLVVIYHCNLSWSHDNWQKTLRSRRPYVVLPIFYPTDQLGMTYSDIRRMFESAKAVVPLSFSEAREITSLTGFTGPFHIIPHGTEKRFHHPNATGDAADRKFVMCANARGGKGVETVERICNQMKIPFRYVTGVPHEKLHLIYRQARVFVHASPDDRMSLTVGESLCAGCRVISSTRDRGNEWFPGIMECDPGNDVALHEAIQWAWNNPDWDWRSNERAREMTWEVAARRWLRLYEEALG
jgi:hypothetical protein